MLRAQATNSTTSRSSGAAELPPAWLGLLGRLLSMIAPVFPYIFWGGLIIGAATILFFLARELLGIRFPALRRKAKAASIEPEWRPTEALRAKAAGRRRQAGRTRPVRTKRRARSSSSAASRTSSMAAEAQSCSPSALTSRDIANATRGCPSGRARPSAISPAWSNAASSAGPHWRRTNSAAPTCRRAWRSFFAAPRGGGMSVQTVARSGGDQASFARSPRCCCCRAGVFAFSAYVVLSAYAPVSPALAATTAAPTRFPTPSVGSVGVYPLCCRRRMSPCRSTAMGQISAMPPGAC